MANSLNATFDNIFDETPPKRLRHSVFLERKDDPVCRSANVRFGSKRRNTRGEQMFSALPPKTGHRSMQSACPKRATSRLMHRSKTLSFDHHACARNN